MRSQQCFLGADRKTERSTPCPAGRLGLVQRTGLAIRSVHAGRGSLLCSSIFARGEQNKVTQKVNAASRRERATNDPRCPHHGATALANRYTMSKTDQPGLGGETASA